MKRRNRFNSFVNSFPELIAHPHTDSFRASFRDSFRDSYRDSFWDSFRDSLEFLVILRNFKDSLGILWGFSGILMDSEQLQSSSGAFSEQLLEGH